MRRIEEMLNAHGRLSTLDLAARIPDATRGQVSRAAQNLSRTNRLRLVGRMARVGKAQPCGIWEAVQREPQAQTPAAAMLGRIHERCIEEGDCWIWQGAMSGSASLRPCVNWGGKTRYVRRLVSEMKGVIPPGFVAVATCGRERCVSPHCVKAVTNKRSKQMAAKRGAFSNPAKIRKASMTRRANSWITEEVVGRVRTAPTAQAAHDETGVSLSYCKAIRRGCFRRDFNNPFVGLLAANDSTRRAA